MRSRPSLSAREREILGVLLRRDEASAADVRAALSDPPSYSAVRTTLGRMVEKGWIAHRSDGPRYVYRAAVDAAEAHASVLGRLIRTFFGGSAPRTVAALLDHADTHLTDEELDELTALIERKRRERA